MPLGAALLIVAIWLFMAIEPLFELKLPPEAQKVLDGWLATISMAIVLSSLVLQRCRRPPPPGS